MEETGASLHQELATMRRAKSESTRDFAYRVKAVASRGTIDAKSLISYVIDGLGECKSDRSNLYEAETFQALQRKLEAYDLAWPVAAQTVRGGASNR